MLIRPEEEKDQEAVFELNAAAFETPAEAGLVDALRQQASPIVSLIAEDAGRVLGHIMFSPVTLSGHPDLEVMGLAPMAVLPGHQMRGIGSALIKAGLEQCKQLGYTAAIVLGHPDYYPRFGFQPSTHFGIDSEYDVPAEVLMAMELEPGSLEGRKGTIRYHAAFKDV